MKTNSGKATRLGLLKELRELMELVGIDSAERLAALLRNPGDSYPSGGLVRTYLLQRQDAPARFIELVRARRREIESQLEGGVQALEIADRVNKVYLVEPGKHLITILDRNELADARLYTIDEISAIISASLTVPRQWVRQCMICDRYFISPSPRSQVCPRRKGDSGTDSCRQEAARRRREAKRQTQRQRQETSSGAMASGPLEAALVI
jgi:hypothetical protein